MISFETVSATMEPIIRNMLLDDLKLHLENQPLQTENDADM
jgi:hypothetical protein